MQRQKVTVRLDPQIIALGRKAAKAYFGSEQKLGMLIEHSIQSYQARQLSELEAAGLISATERALMERLEKKFDEMGKRTIERIGNLIAKESYETTYSSLILEQLLFSSLKSNAGSKLNQLHKEAAQRMHRRLDREGAEQTALLTNENAALVEREQELEQKNVELANKNNDLVTKHRTELERLQEQLKNEREEREQISRWARGLMMHVRNNVSTTFARDLGAKAVDEYAEHNPIPRGI